jgi:hypothetical protein
MVVVVINNNALLERANKITKRYINPRSDLKSSSKNKGGGGNIINKSASEQNGKELQKQKPHFAVLCARPLT